MRRRFLFERTRFGLALVGLVIIGAVLYTWLAGDLFGQWNWAATAAAVMLAITVGLALFVDLFRQQNPFSRVDPLYHLMDVPSAGKLDSGGNSWIWTACPLAIAALILFVVCA